MKDKFSKDTVVFEKIDRPYDAYLKDDIAEGVIVDQAGEGKVLVKWESYLSTPNEPVLENISDLLLEEELDKQISVMEKQYNAVAKKVKAKLDKAGFLILEANALAQEGGFESINDMDDVLGSIYSAMRVVGWNTSSLSC